MPEYPILVAEWRGDQALTIICEECGAEEIVDPDELLNEGIYECPADTALYRSGSTARRCRGTAVMKYEQADQCEGCGKLGFWHGSHETAIDGCCSRRCALQAEYAKQLRERVS